MLHYYVLCAVPLSQRNVTLQLHKTTFHITVHNIFMLVPTSQCFSNTNSCTSLYNRFIIRGCFKLAKKIWKSYIKMAALKLTSVLYHL